MFDPIQPDDPKGIVAAKVAKGLSGPVALLSYPIILWLGNVALEMRDTVKEQAGEIQQLQEEQKKSEGLLERVIRIEAKLEAKD